MRDKDQYYQAITEQATIAEAGGLAKEQSVLLLWFLRNVVGVGELEAYDHVCDGDNDKGIDGLFLEIGDGEGGDDTLVVFQSNYTESPNSKVGPTDVDKLAGAANAFTNLATLEELMRSGAEQSLLELIDLLNLPRRYRDPSSSIKLRCALITTGRLNGDAKRRVTALRERHGDRYIEVWDISSLGPVAMAGKSPERLSAEISIDVDPNVLVTGQPPNRVAILPVSASDVVTWPGIDDRQLFALNVRHELRSNRVSKALDGAIDREAEHRDFLACHNGLTIICDRFEQTARQIKILNPSVVNGAQSVLAFLRAADRDALSEDLRVFAKIVEVAGRPTLEKEVGRRSNTQTGVNSRNLMANHGTQLRLEREFLAAYPDILYETRPDTRDIDKPILIRNDDAAQLLCAIFNRKPWLAVKKNVLFDSDNHAQVFSQHIRAHHVVFAVAVREAVQNRKSEVPEVYRSSWLLTRLIACYLVGEILRSSGSLSDPLGASADVLTEPQLLSSLDTFAMLAVRTLSRRNARLGEADHFRKDFKNEQQLRDLAASAREAYDFWKSFRE